MSSDEYSLQLVLFCRHFCFVDRVGIRRSAVMLGRRWLRETCSIYFSLGGLALALKRPGSIDAVVVGCTRAVGGTLIYVFTSCIAALGHAVARGAPAAPEGTAVGAS